MPKQIQSESSASAADWLVPPALIFNHPDEVLSDPDLTLREKRAILASWASDLRAVEGSPGERQLDNGARLSVSNILEALRMLDERPSTRPRAARRPPATICAESMRGAADPLWSRPPP